MFLSALAAEGGNKFTEYMLRQTAIGKVMVTYWQLLLAIVVLAVLIVVIAIVTSVLAKKARRDEEAEEAVDVSDDNAKGKERIEEIIATNDVSKAAEKEVLPPEDDVIIEPESLVDHSETEEEEPIAEEPIKEEEPAVEEESSEEPIAEEPETEEEPAAEDPVEEVPVQEEEPIAEEPETEEVPAEEETPAEEEAPAEESTPAAEETPADEEPEAKEASEAQEEIVAAEEPKEEPAREEKAPAPKKKPKTETKKQDKTTKEAEMKKEEKKPAAKPATKKPAAKAAPAEEKAVVGKFELCNSNLGGFNYILRANNGQLLYESKSYKSMDSCREALTNFVEAVNAGLFTIRADKFKQYKFILKSPTSNTLLYIGESFSTESSCRSNIESIKRFAPVSPVVDITKEDFVAEFVPYQIPADVMKAVKDGEGAIGRWEIVRVDEDDKTSPFVALLFANNGQLLYESRDYKTYSNCLSGLKTFCNTVKTGTFCIDPDKSGRYKFVLRSKSANSSMEYYGENYDTRSACAKNIESVYRFALRSPLPENN